MSFDAARVPPTLGVAMVEPLRCARCDSLQEQDGLAEVSEVLSKMLWKQGKISGVCLVNLCVHFFFTLFDVVREAKNSLDILEMMNIELSQKVAVDPERLNVKRRRRDLEH